MIKVHLPANTLTMLCSAIALPHFDYADSVCDSCTELFKNRMQSMQSRTARILTGPNIQTHRADICSTIFVGCHCNIGET